MTRKQGKVKKKIRLAKTLKELIICGSSNHKFLDKHKDFSVPFPPSKIINRSQGGANVLLETQYSYSHQFFGKGTKIEPLALYVLNLSFNELLRTASQLEVCEKTYTFRTIQTLELLFSHKLRKNQLLVGLPLPRLSVSLFQRQLNIIQELKIALSKKGIKSFNIFVDIPEEFLSNARYFGKDRYHFSHQINRISAISIAKNISLFLKGAI